MLWPSATTSAATSSARGGADVLAPSSPVPVEVDDLVGRSRFTVRAGDTVAFALHHRSTSKEPPEYWSEDEIVARLDDTALGWHTWSELHQTYDGPWCDLVHHSGRVLYAQLPHLTGWRNSAVRVGNGAWNQRQLDVYGELLHAAFRLPEQLERLGPVTRSFLADLADTAGARWQEQDQGMTRSPKPSSPRAGTTRRRRSPSRSAPRTSTRRT
jgi:hypothetical protein